MGQLAGLRRSVARWLSVALLATACVVVPSARSGWASDAMAVPDDPDPAAEAADEAAAERAAETAAQEASARAVEEAKARLAAARDAEAAARAASRSADGAVRDAEEATIPAVLDRLDATQRVEAAEAAVTRAEGRLASARATLVRRRVELEAAHVDLDVARRQFEDRVVRAYKAGSLATGSTFAITLVREAGSPGELATTLKHLEVLALTGDEALGDAVDRVSAVEAELSDARSRLAAARSSRSRAEERQAEAATALTRASRAIDDAETRASVTRAAADDAEGRLLTVLARTLEAEAGLATAGEPPPAEAEDGLAPAAEPPPAEADDRLSPAAASPRPADDAPAADLDERRGWLSAREGALQRARTLPAVGRRTADDWVCPVEGGAFVNDWGFPRSSQRRHEGTDVFAPIGTEVRAPAAGEVVRTDATDRFDGRRDLGGITVTVEAGDQRWYFAHLDRIRPGIQVGGAVAAGDVVGLVGRTGNARGTPPHLHLGWYVEGIPVNPYASLAVACRTDR